MLPSGPRRAARRHPPSPARSGCRGDRGTGPPAPGSERPGPGSPRDPHAVPSGRSTSDSSVRPRSESQLAKVLRVRLPVLGDLHVQVEVDRRPEKGLDLPAGVRADLAQPGALVADDDALLALPLQ